MRVKYLKIIPSRKWRLKNLLVTIMCCGALAWPSSAFSVNPSTMTGVMEEGSEQSYIFIPDNPTAPKLKIGNNPVFKPFINTPINATFIKTSKGFEVKKLTTKILSSWEKSKQLFQNKPEYSELVKSFSEFYEDFESILTPKNHYQYLDATNLLPFTENPQWRLPTEVKPQIIEMSKHNKTSQPSMTSAPGFLSSMDNSDLSFSASTPILNSEIINNPALYKNIKRNITLAYSKPEGIDPITKRTLLDLFRNILEAEEKYGKALYGFDDSFYPETYQKIYENSKGGVAIKYKSSWEPHCSGSLISKSLVLTAKHCVSAGKTHLETLFNYETGLGNTPKSPEVFAIEHIMQPKPPAGQSLTLDFAILRIKKNNTNQYPSENYPIQCIRKGPLRHKEPLYVIGHPQGKRRIVSDNSFVYFPFRVTKEDFNNLTMIVDIEAEVRSNNQIRQEFLASYKDNTVIIDGVTMFENYSKKFKNQPTIGIDSDTFEGSSGSPVYHKKLHSIIGILIDGENDTQESPYIPGWYRHEWVLPMEAIIPNLENVLPDWENEDGICIK